jgi:hypothetical protein
MKTLIKHNPLPFVSSSILYQIYFLKKGVKNVIFLNSYFIFPRLDLDSPTLVSSANSMPENQTGIFKILNSERRVYYN